MHYSSLLISAWTKSASSSCFCNCSCCFISMSKVVLISNIKKKTKQIYGFQSFGGEQQMRPFSSVPLQIWWSCSVSPVILNSLVFFPVASKFSALSTCNCSLRISLAGEQNSEKTKRTPQKNAVLSCTLTDFGVIHVLAQLRNLLDEERRFLVQLTLVNWKKAAR